MILAIVQARVSSSRLPGKVLKTILDKPMIIHQMERIQCSKMIDKIVLATSNESSDDVLADICFKYHIDVFRGSLNNVLERFYQCTKKYKADQVVRITGDCPLIDWRIIDDVIRLHLNDDNDYTSNTLKLSYPDGLDVEVLTKDTLIRIYKQASLFSEKEHVTPYVYNNKDLFKIGCLENKIDLSRYRWTVDEKEDFEVVKYIYESLYKKNIDFSMEDILNLYKEDNFILKKNKDFLRNEGYKKSLDND